MFFMVKVWVDLIEVDQFTRNLTKLHLIIKHIKKSLTLIINYHKILWNKKTLIIIQPHHSGYVKVYVDLVKNDKIILEMY